MTWLRFSCLMGRLFIFRIWRERITEMCPT